MAEYTFTQEIWYGEWHAKRGRRHDLAYHTAGWWADVVCWDAFKLGGGTAGPDGSLLTFLAGGGVGAIMRSIYWPIAWQQSFALAAREFSGDEHLALGASIRAASDGLPTHSTEILSLLAQLVP